MPTYEYECKQCGHTFEIFQSMSDEPLKTCTTCGGGVRRLIFGGAGVIFKGSGFYVTDKGSSKSVNKGKEKAAKPESKTSDAPSATPAANSPAAAAPPAS